MNPSGHFEMPGWFATEGPDVTWVGPNPFAYGLCLGFDDGSIRFTTTDPTAGGTYQKISPLGDAVNGVASIGTRSLAVSTRSDITFLQIESPSRASPAYFEGGAHGVVSTKSGYFVAPLGPKGVLFLKPSDDSKQMIRVLDGTEGKLYFYRIIALDDGSGKETLVFANRRAGVGQSVFDPDGKWHGIHTMKFEGIDVIDVCGVAPNSLSAIAISKKAEVLWIKDTSTKEDPVALMLQGVEGRVYRVLATPLHLFVLSSQALYVWSNLVDRILFGNTSAPKSRPLVIPMEAVDMNLIDGKYLMLVLAVNGILSPSVAALERQPIEDDAMALQSGFSNELSRRTRLEHLHPTWRVDDIEQGAMVGVG
jgi:hypothetical protein